MREKLLLLVLCFSLNQIVFSSSLKDIRFGGDMQISGTFTKKQEEKIDGIMSVGVGNKNFSLFSTILFDRKNITYLKPSLNYGTLNIETDKATIGYGGVGTSSDFYSISEDGIYFQLKDKGSTYLSYSKEKTFSFRTGFNIKNYYFQPMLLKTEKDFYWTLSTGFSPYKNLNITTSYTKHLNNFYYKIHSTYSKGRYNISSRFFKTPFLSPSIDREVLPTTGREWYVKYILGENKHIVYKTRKIKNSNFYQRYSDIGYSFSFKKIFSDISYSSFKTKSNVLQNITETNNVQIRLREFQKRQPLSLTYIHREAKQIFSTGRKKISTDRISLSKMLEFYPNGATGSFGISRVWTSSRTVDDGYVYIFYPLDGKASLSKRFLTLEYFTSSLTDEYDERDTYEGITLRYTHYFGDDIHSITRPRKTSLHGIVFEDKNGNGRKDKGERGIKDVYIQLDGIWDTKTDKKGKFRFEEIEKLSYELTIGEETLPVGMKTKEYVKKITLKPDKKTSIYIPVQTTGVVKGNIFEDKNNNNILDSDDAPVRDIKVAIDDVSEWSDENGEYVLENVLPGKYKLNVDEESLPTYYKVKTKDIEVVALSSKEMIAPPILLEKIEYIPPQEEEEKPLPEEFVSLKIAPAHPMDIPRGPISAKEITFQEIEKRFKEKRANIVPVGRKFVIFFEEEEARRLSGEMRKLLDECALAASSYPDCVVYIEGHSDAYEDDEKMLGYHRAETISNYLINTGGLPADRVYFKGIEKSKPLATSDTSQGRARNRRVEITIYLIK